MFGEDEDDEEDSGQVDDENGDEVIWQFYRLAVRNPVEAYSNYRVLGQRIQLTGLVG